MSAVEASDMSGRNVGESDGLTLLACVHVGVRYSASVVVSVGWSVVSCHDPDVSKVST